MLNGNHEAYDQPNGISPCLGQFGERSPKGLKRTNG